MTRAEWFEPKWLWLKRFALAAGLGIALMIVGIAADVVALTFVGCVLFAPLIFWVAFIPILHWKDRYIGGASNVWGAFLVFETSSWSKLFYWFIHVLPDWRRSGQYADAP
ncbi:hypothetical protein [Lysobacter sp. cf310]|uniref:hypothetical protein n=1 Tax=Lysobacter sp. cf310 TaxID=1761790 RepID=UPI0008E3519B|nr:hypothetical protein [Lysobacter sp. cf310]SFK46816.1 hypothetical protein SAMN04487938_0942 [Lysobacter sp. cf310]